MRWAGSVAELREACDALVDEVRRASGGTEEVAMGVEVELDGGLSMSLESLDEFVEAVHADDLRRVRSMFIRIGSSANRLSARLWIRVKPSLTFDYPLFMNVTGADRSAVEGAVAVATAPLARRNPMSRKLNRAMLFGAAAVIAPTGAVASWLIDDDATARMTSAASLAVATFFYVMLWLYVPFEFLGPGQKSRLRRFGKSMLGAVGTIALALIASAIWAAIT